MNPKKFTDILAHNGFAPFTGVPCSVFKHLLNYIEAADHLAYYPAASEGEALGLAGGFALAGKNPVVMMQVDGYGNAVNPLSSLQLLYKLPCLLLISWRAQPGVKDAHQHKLMGASIEELLSLFRIPHAIPDAGEQALNKAVQAAAGHTARFSTPYALLIRKGFFDFFARAVADTASKLHLRSEYLRTIGRLSGDDDILIGTTGYCGREMHPILKNRKRFYMMGSMGCALSIGLALAIERPGHRVFVLDGDGALLMKMGTMATVGALAPDNLFHLCFDNQQYESTGGQKTVSASVDFLKSRRWLWIPLRHKYPYTRQSCNLSGAYQKPKRPSFHPYQDTTGNRWRSAPAAGKPRKNEMGFPGRQYRAAGGRGTVIAGKRKGINRRIGTAVILAAGLGMRLRNTVADRPKGFVRLGNRPIIEESLQRLCHVGVERVIIITGYRHAFYEELGTRYAGLETVHNAEYAVSGSLYSLYCARDLIGDDFLLLESDLVYETKALREVLNFPERDVILVSGYTNAGDEVFVEARNSKLVTMNKDKSRLMNIIGELVGISKVSFDLYKQMLRVCEDEFSRGSLMLDYETDGFVRTAKMRNIYCHKVENLIWCEIDDYRHYRNAKERIYPMIMASEEERE